MTASELLAPFSRSHFFQKPHPASSLALLLLERMEVAAWGSCAPGSSACHSCESAGSFCLSLFQTPRCSQTLGPSQAEQRLQLHLFMTPISWAPWTGSSPRPAYG